MHTGLHDLHNNLHLQMLVVMRLAMPTGEHQMTQPTILPIASLKMLISWMKGAAEGPMRLSAAPSSSDAVMIWNGWQMGGGWGAAGGV